MSAATTESIEQRMDRLRHECRVNETGEHTCMADPEVEAAYATWVAEHSHPASAAHAVATEDHDTPGGRAAGDLAWSKRVTAGTAERRLADQRGIELCDLAPHRLRPPATAPAGGRSAYPCRRQR